MYDYLIAFVNSKNGNTDLGRTSYSSKEPLDSMDKIKEAEQKIKEKTFGNPLILSFTLLKHTKEHAHWSELPQCSEYFCSNCNKGITLMGIGLPETCPHCKAIMDEALEEC